MSDYGRIITIKHVQMGNFFHITGSDRIWRVISIEQYKWIKDVPGGQSIYKIGLTSGDENGTHYYTSVRMKDLRGVPLTLDTMHLLPDHQWGLAFLFDYVHELQNA